MIDIPNKRLNKQYSMLEQQAGLILSIGRRIEGQSKTNRGIKREDLALNSDGSYPAYCSLQEERIIEQYRDEDRALDEEPLPLKVRFTKKGRDIYKVLEKAYKENWLTIVKSAITCWDSDEEAK